MLIFIALVLAIGLAWGLSQAFLAVGPGASWAAVGVVAVLFLMFAGRRAWRASGIRPRRRLRTLRELLTESGKEPSHLVAVRVCWLAGFGLAPIDAPLRGMRFLSFGPSGLQLWRVKRRVFTVERTFDVQELIKADLATGGDSGYWTDRPSVLSLWLAGTPQPHGFLVPGEQPEAQSLAWRLDQDARPRRRARRREMPEQD